MIQSKNCRWCNSIFYKRISCSKKEWEKSPFCNRKCSSDFRKGKPFKHGGSFKKGQVPWNKDKKGLQVAWNKGNGEYAKKLGFGKWMLGKKASLESREKNSEAMKKRITEGKHNFYIDGRTPLNCQIRHSYKYKLWRESVFKRDDYTCQECKKRGAYLNSDHIKQFAYFPKLRFKLSNGRTLCRECHYKRHSKINASSIRLTFIFQGKS